MKIIMTLIGLVVFFTAAALPDSLRVARMAAYLDHSHRARMLLAEKKNQEAIGEYRRAFEYYQMYVPDLLSCADAYETLGDMDSAFIWLNVAAANGWDWKEDNGPGKLKASKVYSERVLEKSREDFLKTINKAYLDSLDNMLRLDQSVRGADLDTVQMKTIDSINMEQLVALVKQYGLPRYERVGYTGATDAFVIMLHGFFNGAYGSKMWEFFQPILLQELKQGYMMPEYYAFLYDRVVSDYGRLEQCYGTQFSYAETGSVTVNPVYDVAHVDQRRKDIGLPPLADMIKSSHMKAPMGYVVK
ncbi:MAG: hypothetical protein JSS76_12815 [Bacteroidetes bacterium]|nr:hypothetical protein [Bacteroidota bacterium]